MRKSVAGQQSDDTEAAIAALIAAQHGVISRAQALSAGMTAGAVRHRLESGAWSTMWAGVYSPAAVPDSWHRRLMGACLAGGPSAVASHRAAGALWQFEGRPSGIIEVSLASAGTRSLQRVVLHRTRSLPVADRTHVEAIPVTRPGRTLIDLAAVLSADPLEQAVDSALRDGLVTVPYLDRQLHELGARGRNGTGLLGELLEDRREGRPAESQAENRLLRALLAAGLPKPVRQYDLFDEQGLAARFDLAYLPPYRIGIEFDSFQHHSGRQAWRHDQVRHNRATAMGWLVFHLTADADVAPVVHAYRNRPAA